MGTRFEDLPIDSHVRVKLKSGTTFTATLSERTETELVFASDIGGMRLSLGENEIENLQPCEPEQPGREAVSEGELAGTIKVFKKEYMWGVILADNGLDYQFNEANIADPSLREKLVSLSMNEILGTAVNFNPSILRKRNGDSKDIAIEVTLSAEEPLPKQPCPLPLDQLTSNDAGTIPHEIKEQVYRILLQEERSKGHPLLLSQAAPLLKREGIDPARYGYSKAKPFFLSLGFVNLDESGKAGAERIVLNQIESDDSEGIERKNNGAESITPEQIQGQQPGIQGQDSSTTLEDDAGKPSLWQRLFGERTREKEAKPNKINTKETNTVYSTITFEDQHDLSTEEHFEDCRL